MMDKLSETPGVLSCIKPPTKEEMEEVRTKMGDCDDKLVILQEDTAQQRRDFENLEQLVMDLDYKVKVAQNQISNLVDELCLFERVFKWVALLMVGMSGITIISLLHVTGLI